MHELSLLAQHPPIGASLAGRRREIVALGALWLALLLIGFAGLLLYGARPGQPAAAPGRWPGESRLAREAGQPTLVMLLHPRCPCSRASLRELERLLGGVRGGLTTHAVLVEPPGSDAGGEETGLERLARAIPGVLVSRDAGDEARLFGARTSGQVVLYDDQGALRFEGGVTGSRGHEGDNAGRAALEALLGARLPLKTAATPVFGCGLGVLP